MYIYIYICTCVYIYIFVYTYIYIYGNGGYINSTINSNTYTANRRSNIMDFRGFDSGVILIVRGGIPRPIGNFPESLSQAILIGIMLVGRLGVVMLVTATALSTATHKTMIITIVMTILRTKFG